jgi:hypothetical protein
MPDVANNPASRLLAILKSAKGIPADQSIRHAWATILQIDEKDTPGLLGAIAELIHLVRDTKVIVKSADGLNADVYLKLFTPIENAFAHCRLVGKWDQFTNHIDSDTLARLEILSHSLAITIPEPVPDADILAKLLEDVENLLSQTIAADLPQQLKTAIIDNLEVIRNAIRSFRIRGIAGLVESLLRSANSVVINSAVINGESQYHEVKQFLRILRRLNEIVGAASNAKAVLLPAVQYLLSGGS